MLTKFSPSPANILPRHPFSYLTAERWQQLSDAIRKETTRKNKDGYNVAVGNTKSIKTFWVEALKASGMRGLDLNEGELGLLAELPRDLRYSHYRMSKDSRTKALIAKAYLTMSEDKYYFTQKTQDFVGYHEKHQDDVHTFMVPCVGSTYQLTFLGAVAVVSNLRVRKLM